jgi:hypothetical protein
VKVDEMFVVEGCHNDNMILLGDKNEFMSHFCTLFNFDACYAYKERKVGHSSYQLFSDPERLNDKIEDLISKFDAKMD